MSSYSWHRPNPQSVFEVKYGSWQAKRDTEEISAPEIVGYFSLDGDRTYLPDSRNLSYYKSPKSIANVSFDLDQGMESVIRKTQDPEAEGIDKLLEWITLNREKIQAEPESKRWIQPNFVCFRGLLTMLFCTPFSPRDGWIISAAKWRGTIYLYAYKTLEEKRRCADFPPRVHRIMSWGFKFEKYILSDAPDKDPDTTQPVNESEEFCCMFQRRFGEHTILYGAEMDGVLSEKTLNDPLPLKDLRFVELKTCKTIESNSQDRNFRKFKLIKWWSQSFLVGIDNVLCGFRDDNGIVRNLTNYSLSQIVDMSKSYWNASSCINFCTAFLSHVSKTVVNDCDKTIYKFERRPFENILTTEISPSSEYAFLPSSYLEESGCCKKDEREIRERFTKVGE